MDEQVEIATQAPHELAAPHNTAPATSAASDASDAELAEPIGETRRLADILIENAKLLTQVEGRDQVISELRGDRDFLREEVREARRTRDDVKSIANRTLETLETMALGGKFLRSGRAPTLDHEDVTGAAA